jgi:hypothetical protein
LGPESIRGRRKLWQLHKEELTKRNRTIRMTASTTRFFASWHLRRWAPNPVTAEIRWAEESARWLRDIHDYIAADNPKAAAKVVASNFGNAQLLKEQPEIEHGLTKLRLGGPVPK